MGAGKWTPDDDTTWHCSCVFGFFWVFTILVETSLRYKFNLFWNVVVVATLVNVVKLVLVIRYSEMIRWHQAEPDLVAYGYQIYAIYEIVNIFVHVLKCFGMYQRKRLVKPSSGWMDVYVLVFTMLFSISSSLVCYFNINVGCWAVSNPIQAVSLIATVGYFEFYYIYLIVNGINRLEFDRDLFEVLMPVMWTTLTYLVYTCCCLIYRQEGADFYVNALWNFASVLIPLVTIQSCISTNIGAFVEKKGPKGENYKLVNSSSRSLSISSKPTNIVYHAN